MESRKRVFYIMQYDIPGFEIENRSYSLSGTNKGKYIVNTLVESGFDVILISPAWTKNEKGVFSGRKNQITENLSFEIAPTFGANNKFMKLLRMSHALVWLFLYLLKNTSSNDTIIMYHALFIDNAVYFAKKLVGFNLVLEVEEKYNAVTNQNKVFSSIENKIIELADKYIFCNDIISDLVNIKNKKNVVVYGDYTTYRCNVKFSDGKIHVIYSGIIDKVKAGAFMAINSARYLNNNYSLHIIGTGKVEDILELRNQIEAINRTANCHVTYDGVKSGDDFVKYLCRMDIGLSSQTPSGQYLLYSFPSKILSYLSVGLEVVSARFESLEKSKISQILNYYEEDTPESIANAIINVSFDKDNKNAKILNVLHSEFIEELRGLIND